MHSPASVLENDTHELLWDFDIQMEPPNLGPKTRFYNQEKKNENLQNYGICYSNWQ